MGTTKSMKYGIADLTIYTDHQSLIFSISEKNPNNKLKRWKNLIEEYGAKIIYKPGTQNVVADALSRQQINQLSTDNDSIHSQNSSPYEQIKRINKSVNHFSNQIIIEPGGNNPIQIHTKQIFDNLRHTIYFTTIETLKHNLKEVIQPNKVNAIFTTAEILFLIEKPVLEEFPAVKFIITNSLVEDISDTDSRTSIVEEIHNRAHRNFKNNTREINEKYYWPNIVEMTKAQAKICEICKTCKYDRRPNKIPFGKTPIPNKVGTHIHIDTFYMNRLMYICTIDKYSKYCFLREIQTKKDVYRQLDEILSQIFPNAKTLVSDNEACYTSIQTKMLLERLQITHITTPPYHSTTNGQVERLHSTIAEITNSLAKQHKSKQEDIIFEAVKQYNKTIHSTTGYKPEDVFFNQQGYPDIKEKLKIKQDKILNSQQGNFKDITYQEGDVIYIKTHCRDKSKNKFRKNIVKTDNGRTITTIRNKIVHKDNIRIT